MAAAALLLCGCGASEEAQGDPVSDTTTTTPTAIRLRSANKLIVTPSGRAPYIGAIDAGNPLTARVISSTATGNYVTARHENAEMTFGSAAASGYNPSSLSGPEKGYFPGDPTSPLYLTGLYPLAGWTLAEAETVATIDITGCEDVMAAAEVVTSAVQVKAGDIETLIFNHLLTKIEIGLQALNADAVVKWGKVTKIELAKANGAVPQSRVAVNLKNAVVMPPDTPAQAPQAFYGMSMAGGVGAYTDVPFAGATLTEAGATVAYSMIAPFVATETNTDLTFDVYTEMGGTTPVSVDVALSAAGDTAGRAFSITFTFSADQTYIRAMADVMPWNEDADEIVAPLQ